MLKSVTVLSGGMDSAVLAYYLKDQGYDQFFLSFDYGQRHSKELLYAARIANTLYGNNHHQIIQLTDITRLLTTSALTADVPIPDGHYSEDSMRVTVVPNRNPLMLSAAFAVASSMEATAVSQGIHSGDRYQYPDCRLEFAAAFQQMENKALEGFPTPILMTPFIMKSKAEIAKLGGELKVPFENTWSCYKGGSKHCGVCGTCCERLEAMFEAGVEDKTEYEDNQTWKKFVAEYKALAK